jgi:hypothetical protein
MDSLGFGRPGGWCGSIEALASGDDHEAGDMQVHV